MQLSDSLPTGLHAHVPHLLVIQRVREPQEFVESSIAHARRLRAIELVLSKNQASTCDPICYAFAVSPTLTSARTFTGFIQIGPNRPLPVRFARASRTNGNKSAQPFDLRYASSSKFS